MDPELKAALDELTAAWNDFRGKSDDRYGKLEARVNRMNLGTGGVFDEGSPPLGGFDPSCVKHGQPLARKRSGLHAGRLVRGMITGKWEGAEKEFLAASEGTIAGGGVIVPSPLSAELIDLARNAMVLSKAGARVVLMDGANLLFPTVTSAAAAAWIAENAPASETSVVFGSATLKARKVVALTRSSMELAADAPNFAALLQDQLAKATALAFDYAGLCGTGVGENPMGIASTPGIGTSDVNGAITVDKLLDAYFALLAANVDEDSISCILPSGIAKNLAQLKYTEQAGATNAYLAGITWPESLKKVKFFATNAIPSVATKATIIMGDFAQLYMGVRLGGQINVSNAGVIGGESVFERSQLAISFIQRGDFVLARPSAFYTLTRVNA